MIKRYHLQTSGYYLSGGYEMRRKCSSCGNVFYNKKICPNCGSITHETYQPDVTWFNRYASEKMTKEEAGEFFESDKY